MAAAPRVPGSARGGQNLCLTKGRAGGPTYQVREQWLHSVPLIWRPRAAAPRWARAGMLGDPRACSCPAKLVMLHGAALLTQFFPSS